MHQAINGCTPLWPKPLTQVAPEFEPKWVHGTFGRELDDRAVWRRDTQADIGVRELFEEHQSSFTVSRAR